MLSVDFASDRSGPGSHMSKSQHLWGGHCLCWGRPAHYSKSPWTWTWTSHEPAYLHCRWSGELRQRRPRMRCNISSWWTRLSWFDRFYSGNSLATSPGRPYFAGWSSLKWTGSFINQSHTYHRCQTWLNPGIKYQGGGLLDSPVVFQFSLKPVAYFITNLGNNRCLNFWYFVVRIICSYWLNPIQTYGENA